MFVAPGVRFGSYEVTAKIGEGGMGEVYRARDTKLDRDVALRPAENRPPRPRPAAAPSVHG